MIKYILYNKIIAEADYILYVQFEINKCHI